jgi:anti-sigma regulatory factor (Ser/Thr protein kinase)
MKSAEFAIIVNKIIDEKGHLINRDLVAASGLSRQAIHKRLREMVRQGRIVREGKGRATRYVPAEDAGARLDLRLDGLDEGRVWADMRDRVEELADLDPKAMGAVEYAFTEMLNNAIDHSSGSRVRIRWMRRERRLEFEIRDDGIGVFAKIQKHKGLASVLHAMQELSKGKLTTSPEQHSGEGIFFVSKLGERFELESQGHLWLVDNARADQAWLEREYRPGTRVAFALDLDRVPELSRLFEQYTSDFRFARSRIRIKLFEIDQTFVSRSEGKRLCEGLERFEEVEMDFAGVAGVGQGFADEVFRVWSNKHPQVKLEPLNMNTTVAFMIARARRAADRSSPG